MEDPYHWPGFLGSYILDGQSKEECDREGKRFIIYVIVFLLFALVFNLFYNWGN